MRIVAAVILGICALWPLDVMAAGNAPAGQKPRRTVLIVKKVKPARAKRAPHRPKRAKPAPAVKDPPLPGPVDDKSLGFGSSRDDVQRLMGKPTRVAKGMNGAVWFYGLSSITIKNGKVTAWCKYDRPLPMNIGSAQPGARPAKIGSTVPQLIAARGTPDTVAAHPGTQVWFYGAYTYTIRHGKVVPTDFGPGQSTPREQAAPKRTTAAQPRPTPASIGQRCYCPL